jgi:hypothetical protein
VSVCVQLCECVSLCVCVRVCVWVGGWVGVGRSMWVSSLLGNSLQPNLAGFSPINSQKTECSVWVEFLNF